MEHECIAFMSYSHFDDQHDRGKLSELRNLLSGEVRMQTGKEFPIFQDRTSIQWGDNWKKKIVDSLNSVTFLIPIVSPSFFASKPCREELEIFANREKQLGRNDCIFPVYYVDCSRINNDEFTDIIFSRQHADMK